MVKVGCAGLNLAGETLVAIHDWTFLLGPTGPDDDPVRSVEDFDLAADARRPAHPRVDGQQRVPSASAGAT